MTSRPAYEPLDPPVPYEPIPVRRVANIPTRPLPIPSELPSLPSPPRQPFFFPGYSVTTHLVPAAYPRVSTYQARLFPEPIPAAPSTDSVNTRTGRTAWAKETSAALVKQRAELRQCNLEQPLTYDELPRVDEPLLWNVVNRYARTQVSEKKSSQGLTLIVTHAHGFHKEIWEPTLKNLISRCEQIDSKYHIDEVWSLDSINHGDGALVNDGKLPVILDWLDMARDVLNFLENFIPAGPFVASKTALPVHLPRVSQNVSFGRVSRGFADRYVVGIGHSLGGCFLARAACESPHLFHSITLVEPIILIQAGRRTLDLAFGSLTRRRAWASREEAKKQLSTNPYFSVWDPEVLDVYIQYALTDVPEKEGGGVWLKMTGFQEAVTAVESLVPQETFQLIASLDKRVSIRWIMGPQRTEPSRVEQYRRMIWRRPANSVSVRIERSGHLVIQEAPRELAEEIYLGWVEQPISGVASRL